MKLPSLIAVASLSLVGPAWLRADDATTPVDLTRRNGAFAPGATISPEQKPLARDSQLQEKRFEKSTIEKQPAAVGDRRAAIEVQETRDKTVREKDSHRPERTEQAMSQFNRRDAAITTAGANTKPAMVAKYQNSLSAASASNMARFPAIDAMAASKINRFVFRKNAPEAPALTGDAAITPAGGGGKVLK